MSKHVLTAAFLGLAGLLMTFGGCSCEEEKDAAEVVSDKFTGESAIQQGEALKKQVRDIAEEQAGDSE